VAGTCRHLLVQPPGLPGEPADSLARWLENPPAAARRVAAGYQAGKRSTGPPRARWPHVPKALAVVLKQSARLGAEDDVLTSRHAGTDRRGVQVAGGPAGGL